MPNPSQIRPDPSEYNEYYETYVKLVPENDIVHALALQGEQTLSYFRTLPPDAGEKRYAPGKWSVKEVVGHVIDIERLFAARALFFARNTPGPLPGIEQDDWMKLAAFAHRSLPDLADEFESVRRTSLHLFRHLDLDSWMRKGVASGKEFTVRSISYIILGHERHHVAILKSRYS
ncbi:MAG TPA: DinB family protein [Bacteroidota bacterium]|nr:DinB family protein [Bacteroidota bacterium]